MIRELERRHIHLPVEWRAGGGGLGQLGGYAAVFNRLSQNLGGFVETVDPSAFAKAIGDGQRVMCRTHHDSTWLLGTTEAMTLRLSVDGTGLLYEVDLPDTTAGRDTQALAQRGDLRYSSFAFKCVEDEWSITPDGFPLRTLLAVQLIDVAPVVEPAYLDSTTGMRSLAARLDMPLDEVQAKAVAEIRAMLAGEPADTVVDGPETPDSDEDADDGVETNSAPEGEDAQRETHAPVTIRARQMELERMR